MPKKQFYIEPIFMDDSIKNPNGTYSLDIDFLESLSDAASFEVESQRIGLYEHGPESKSQLLKKSKHAFDKVKDVKGVDDIYSVIFQLRKHNDLFDITKSFSCDIDYILTSKVGGSAVLFSLNPIKSFQTGFSLTSVKFDSNYNALCGLYHLASICKERGVKEQSIFSFELDSSSENLNVLRGIYGVSIYPCPQARFKVKVDLYKLKKYYDSYELENNFDCFEASDKETFKTKKETYFTETDDDEDFSQLFGFVVKDETGKSYGGIICKVIQDRLFIDMLAIDEHCRGQEVKGKKISRLLLKMAEQKGAKLGCKFAEVSTASFQAPWLYPSFYSKDENVCKFVKVTRVPMGASCYFDSNYTTSKKTLFWAYDYVKKLRYEGGSIKELSAKVSTCVESARIIQNWYRNQKQEKNLCQKLKK